MALTRRRCCSLTLLLMAAALATACDPLSLPFFILGPEPKVEPLLKKLASDDKEKDVKVVVLTYGGLETRPEFLRADRELTIQIVKQLRELCKTNGEKVTLVSPSKVEEFKNNHPNWHTLDPADIGNHFDADFVIDVEVNDLSLYEKGSNNLLYHGHAELTLKLIDLNNPDEDQEQKELTLNYPNDAAGQIPVEDKPQQVFLAEFYHEMAQRVAWHFSAHPTSDDYRCASPR